MKLPPIAAHQVQPLTLPFPGAALSKLLAASLREDEYGVAQVDIPRTLESFVTCLEGLEALDADLQKMAKSKHDEAAIRDAVWRHLRPVQTCASPCPAAVYLSRPPR